MKETEFIWKNGDFIDWKDATTHVLTHALHYGTGVFEGIRAYKTDSGSAIFRAKEHYNRLIDSAKMYLMPVSYSSEEFIEVTLELIRKNSVDSCYIRPLIYRGYGEMGLNPAKSPVDSMIALWEWGTYLGEEALKSGVKCKISSWGRLDSRVMPPLAKATANYANSVLAKQEAIDCGYDEAILLNINGTIAEGPGENLFLIKDGVIYTPPSSDCVLKGITAQSVKQVALDSGFNVIEKSLIRDELFIADELFFTGTAAEVTPIREIDGRVIGSGQRGPVTEQLQSTFFDIVQGKNDKYSDWLTLA